MSKSFDDAIANVLELKDSMMPIVDSIVGDNVGELDTLMESICNDVVNNLDVSVVAIERAFTKLTNTLYFIAPKVERFGLYDSMSKLKMKEEFNNSYINNDVKDASGKSPTAAKLSTLAEVDSKYEYMVNDMYNKCYKIMKSKVDAAQVMVSTLSKILSRRISEQQLSGLTDNKRILNE